MTRTSKAWRRLSSSARGGGSSRAHGAWAMMTLGGIALIAACGPVATPTQPDERTDVTRLIDPASLKDRIAVEVVGTGPDVVLIHGLGSSREVWRDTIAAVPGYRYHLVQIGGFAGAAPGRNADGPLIEPVADAIADYITRARLGRPAIVGHSMGGSIGMALARLHPDAVGRLMVVDMVPFLGMLFGGPAATPDSVEPIATQVRTRIVNATPKARRIEQEKTLAGMIRTEARRPQAVEHALSSNARVTGQGMYDLITTDHRAGLMRYRGPLRVLYVYPDGAPVPEPAYDAFVRMSFAAVPGATVAKVPDSAHFIMWDAPDRFRAELKSFLTR